MIDPFFMPRMYPVIDPPEPRRNWALFLDLDGTLLDIAQTPYAVTVPEDLTDNLRAASSALNGALAIVSGRLLTEVDYLLTPLKLPSAGEHGGVIRMPDGTHDEVDAKIPFSWVEALSLDAAQWPGVLIERKTHGVVAHYRRAPKFAEPIRKRAQALVAQAPDTFEILEGKMAIEIRPRTVTKARAVHRLMSAEPFAGRVPVFVGDDLTDHDGFKAAEALGGLAVDVFERFGGRTADVRAWVREIGRL